MDSNLKRSITLWNEIRTGNLNSLGKLYDDSIDNLFIYGSKFSSDKQLVQDCIHDLFLNIYKYRLNIGETDNVNYYLMGSLKNLIFKSLKNNSRSSSLLTSEQLRSNEESAEEKIIAEDFNCEKSKKLNTAMRLLSKKQRKGILLRFSENQTYEEIAVSMHISVQSSRTMIYRAVKTLRKEMLLLLWFLTM